MKWLVCAYAWVKDNDLPNTFTFVVTFILWPLAVLWWNTRKVNSISNLIVAYIPGHNAVAIGQTNYPSVEILFENQTGPIVYITGPRIRNCSARFPVPITAVKDTGENAYPLSFLNPASGIYEGHQITLQTNGKAASVMAVTTTMPTEFYQYKTPTLRRLFKSPKYFIIEYIAMVGQKTYVVKNVR